MSNDEANWKDYIYPDLVAFWVPALIAGTLVFWVHSCNETEEYIWGPAGKTYIDPEQVDDELTLSQQEAVVFGKAFGECDE